MEIKQISQSVAEYFIKKYHYSKILPKLTKYYLGYFIDDNLVGVLTLGWGTQPLQTIRKIFYNHKLSTNDYLEIGKMCFLPQMNSNKSFGSQTLSQTFNWVKQNTNCLFIYTMADGIMGKCGYVYQAASMTYLGSFKTQVYMDLQTNEKIHPRSAKILLKENAKLLGVEKVCWLTEDFCKQKGIAKISGLMFRYIKPLNKKAKKILDQYDEYKNLTYPKDKDLIFEQRIEQGKFARISKPNFDMNIQKYNVQKGKQKPIQLDLFDNFEGI